MSRHDFKSFGEFAEFLTRQLPKQIVALHEGLEVVCRLIEKQAKSEIGTYQAGIAGFPAWAELADYTKDERVRLGYTENDPLLRSGKLRDSIGHEVHVLEGIVGSTSEIMVWQELGTPHIPPRPVLGPAPHHVEEEIFLTIGRAAIAGMMGDTLLPKPYGFTVE